MGADPDTRLTRIGVFYDGNYFSHVSNYYVYHHERRSRISLTGLHAFLREEVARREGVDSRYCQIVEAHYFRGRAAYHFYPHNVYFDARNDRLPPASAMRAGDWLFVYQRPGIQFDRSQNMLRWDDGQTHAAEVKMIAPGAALFRLM